MDTEAEPNLPPEKAGDEPALTDPGAGAGISLDQLLLVLAGCALWVLTSRLTILLSPWPRWVCDLAWIWLPFGSVLAAWRVNGHPLYRRLR